MRCFAGEHINGTEDRAVMHFLLRYPAAAPGSPAQDAVRNVASELAEVHATLDAMLAYAEKVRGDHTITDVVNIGIGGSDLGRRWRCWRWRNSRRRASASISSRTSTATNSTACSRAWRPSTRCS